MRIADVLAMGGAALLACGCASPTLTAAASAPETSSASDCAIITAIAKEHYKFGPENAPPPLKASGETGWRPVCDFSASGFSFTDYDDSAPSADPRARLRWVAFERPVYDGDGATVATEIMHGPLAGMGYECRVLSGFTGWTVGACKTSWVS